MQFIYFQSKIHNSFYVICGYYADNVKLMSDELQIHGNNRIELMQA